VRTTDERMKRNKLIKGMLLEQEEELMFKGELEIP